MSDDLPLVLTLRTPGTDVGAVDTHVHCINVTSTRYHVAVTSAGFTTIDDEGTMMHHGSAPVEVTLDPGEAAQIADVVAWEWDGAVWLSVKYTDPATGSVRGAAYNLKHGIDDRPPKRDATKSGYVTPPAHVTTLAGD